MSRAHYLFWVSGAICLYGGTWQTQRRKQKIEHLEFMQKRITAKPVECPTSLTESELDERKMQRVYVEGVPDFKNEIVVGPDPPPRTSGINSTEYEWGGYVYTPITLRNGTTILMNRGWIKDEDALECPEPAQSTDDGKDSKWYAFCGLLTPLEFVPHNVRPFDVAKLFWPFINRVAINTRWSDINIPPDQEPVVITVTDPASNENIPVRLKERDFMSVKVSPSQHLSYMIFWYSMCGISWFYAYRLLRNPKASRLFKRRFTRRPVLRRSDIDRMPEQDLKLQ